jgi:hypothetical protein
MSIIVWQHPTGYLGTKEFCNFNNNRTKWYFEFNIVVVTVVTLKVVLICDTFQDQIYSGRFTELIIFS